MLQLKLEQFGQKLSMLTDNCYHYFRANKTMPCIVWAEDGEENSFNSDNRKTEQNITGTIHAFSKTEYDALFDGVQYVLDQMGATWSLESVQYEEDTQLIHYEWRWGCAFNWRS